MSKCFSSVLSAMRCIRHHGGDPVTAIAGLNNGDAVLGIVRWYLDRAAAECGMAHFEYRIHDGVNSRFTTSAMETAQAHGNHARVVDVAYAMALRDSLSHEQTTAPPPAPDSGVRTCWIATSTTPIKSSHWRRRKAA